MGVGKNNSDFSLLGRKNGAAHGAVISHSFKKHKQNQREKGERGEES